MTAIWIQLMTTVVDFPLNMQVGLRLPCQPYLPLLIVPLLIVVASRQLARKQLVQRLSVTPWRYIKPK